MNVATINRKLGVNWNQVPTQAQIRALAVDAAQPPHIRNSAKQLLRGRRYTPLTTYMNPQPLQ